MCGRSQITTYPSSKTAYTNTQTPPPSPSLAPNPQDEPLYLTSQPYHLILSKATTRSTTRSQLQDTHHQDSTHHPPSPSPLIPNSHYFQTHKMKHLFPFSYLSSRPLPHAFPARPPPFLPGDRDCKLHLIEDGTHIPPQNPQYPQTHKMKPLPNDPCISP